jgi:predicted DsbA family dithiol-disulfide isomerase
MDSQSERSSESSSLARLLGIEPAIIEVVCDVVCPWCYVGKHQLEKALTLLGRDNVEIHWKPFQLNPTAPAEGVERRYCRALKFGRLSGTEILESGVVEDGRRLGIEIQLERLKTVPNTFNAHRLIWLAGKEGEQGRLVENLFHAYFGEGENIGKLEVLRRIGIESLLDPRRVDELLSSSMGASQVVADERLAHRRGVSFVPAFVYEGKVMLSGAQSAKKIANALRLAIGPGFTAFL